MVFKSLLNDLVDLNTRIKDVINGISKYQLEDVAKSVWHRFRECIDSNGAHLQNVVFKS